MTRGVRAWTLIGMVIAAGAAHFIVPRWMADGAIYFGLILVASWLGTKIDELQFQLDSATAALRRQENMIDDLRALFDDHEEKIFSIKRKIEGRDDYPYA